MHPNLAQLYRERVAELHAALRRDPEGREALEIVRGLIERIGVGPAADGKGFDIEVVGAIAAMTELGLPGKRAAGGGDRDLFAEFGEGGCGDRI